VTSSQPRAYSYIRWSSEKQRAGDSLRRQTEAARKWAQARGLELDESTSYLDAGVSAFSGTNAETGRLGEFLQAIKDGIVPRGSYLLVESLDRISRRKPRPAVRVMESICDEGVAVVTLADGRTYTKDSLDDDPMSFIYAIMVAMRAHEEVATKSMRVRAARGRNREQAAAGIKITSKTPAWLILSADRKSFVVDEKKAAVIQRIYEMYDAGLGTTTIARTLNEDGEPTFGGAAGWMKQYVGKILHSKAPAGTLEQHVHREPGSTQPRVTKVDEVPGYFPPVVDAALAARVALKVQGVQPKGRHAHQVVRNPFAGVGRCPTCGGSIVRVSNSQRHGNDRLICARARSRACTNGKSVTLRFVLDALRTQVGRLLDPTEQAGTADVHAVHEADIAVEQAREAVIQLAEQIAMDPSRGVILRAAMDIAETRLEEAQEARKRAVEAALTAAGPAWNVEKARLLGALEAGDVPGVNQALRRMAAEVEIDIAGKTITVFWRTGVSGSVAWGSVFPKWPPAPETDVVGHGGSASEISPGVS